MKNKTKSGSESLPSKNKLILKKQSSMKVVLNGGSYVLNDSTIPFQIAFDKELAGQNPQNILVIDITNMKERGDGNYCIPHGSERTLFDLEPINYLQLKKAGKHRLIFILLGEVDEDYYNYLFGFKYGCYNHEIAYSYIEDNNLQNQIAYCEALVEVPEEFFAIKPATGLKKAIWGWVNRWHRMDPVDQCEYRKRKITAFSIQPIAWLVGLMLRLFTIVVMNIVSLFVKLLGTIIGYWPIHFFPNRRTIYVSYLFAYPKVKFGKFTELWFQLGEDSIMAKRHISDRKDLKHYKDEYPADWYPYKKVPFFGKTFHAPVTFAEIILYAALFFFYYISIYAVYTGAPKHVFDFIMAFFVSCALSFVLSLFLLFSTAPSIRDYDGMDEARKKKNYTIHKQISGIITSIMLFVSFIALIINLVRLIPKIQIESNGSAVIYLLGAVITIAIIVYVVFRFFRKNEKAEIRKSEKKEIKRERRLEKNKRSFAMAKSKIESKKEWIQKTFDPAKLPEKIDFQSAPDPWSQSHKIVLLFWKTKAKVCKPYEK